MCRWRGVAGAADPSCCVLVDDSWSNMKAAKAAGWTTVLCGRTSRGGRSPRSPAARQSGRWGLGSTSRATQGLRCAPFISDGKFAKIHCVILGKFRKRAPPEPPTYLVQCRLRCTPARVRGASASVSPELQELFTLIHDDAQQCYTRVH